MKILYTGSEGFIGKNIAELLKQAIPSCQVIGLDKSRTTSPHYDYSYQQSISEFVESSDEVFDCIMHGAALAPLPDNQINLARSVDNNITDTARLIDYAIATGTSKFIFLSTSAVYENSTSDLSESALLSPTLQYSQSKYLSEVFLGSVAKTYSPMNISILRLANVYGPEQSYERKQPPLIGYLLKCYFQNECATLYANGDFKRDYVYVGDVAQIMAQSIGKTSSGCEIFNVGSGYNYSVPDILNTLEELGVVVDVAWGNPEDYWHKYPELDHRKIKINRSLIQKEVEKVVSMDLTKASQTYNLTFKSLKEGLPYCIRHAEKYFGA